jgi:coenzyme F420-dependent glucose-6-phosphate dehydrogenase
MARIGYHASHEQFTPRDLLGFAKLAEEAGFDAVMSSDHFAPWSHAQGESGFMWAWVGAALQAIRIPVGFITVPCGWRYHPAIVAQASATLCQMFPGRLPWIAVGSGEALNECAVGADWPDKPERNARLLAGVDIMRRLWDGQEVNEAGPIRTENAKLYTRAEEQPRIMAGVLSKETAGWAGRWADGLITVNQSTETLTEIIDAFRGAGGAGKPLFLQVHVAIAEDDAAARAHAFDQWRFNAVSSDAAANLTRPEDFERLSEKVRPGDMDRHVFIASDAAAHAAKLAEYAEMGFSEIYVHNVGRNQREFIGKYGEQVLPKLKAG